MAGLKVPFDEVDQLSPNRGLSPPTSAWLAAEMSVTDLNEIHGHLWLAGRKGNISALHHQILLQRKILITERSRLHLVWYSQRIYIKPIPRCMLNYQYFDNSVCHSQELHRKSLGFLRTYAMLIQHPSDLDIAKTLGLVPRRIKWSSWERFRASIIANIANSDVNKRYEYGELRLDRLDLIYLLTLRDTAYFNTHRQYYSYFHQYLALFFAIFAFFSIVLTAMQVLLAIQNIPELIVTTCYRFSIVALFAIVVGVGGTLLLFVIIFMYHVGRTILRIMNT